MIKEALRHLDRYEEQIVDKMALQETRGKLDEKESLAWFKRSWQRVQSSVQGLVVQNIVSLTRL